MKYRKKPVIIDAIQFNPLDDSFSLEYWNINQRVYKDWESKTGWSCDTLEGKHEVTPGDWIITGVKGEKYPCKPDIFEMTYEKVEEILKKVYSGNNHIGDVYNNEASEALYQLHLEGVREAEEKAYLSIHDNLGYLLGEEDENLRDGIEDLQEWAFNLSSHNTEQREKLKK